VLFWSGRAIVCLSVNFGSGEQEMTFGAKFRLGRFELLARGRRRSMSSTSRERLHRVDSVGIRGRCAAA
jgi:hypothetical protein